MSASDRSTARPVALLARPGVARDRLREAVLAAGGALVLEEDPGALDPAVLQAVGPAMVLVALGLFAFAKFLMWRDLDPVTHPGLLEHPTLLRLLHHQ